LAVFIQKPTSLLNLLIKKMYGFIICEFQVSDKENIVSTFFKASLGNVEETEFVGFTEFLESFRNICLYGNGSPSEL